MGLSRSRKVALAWFFGGALFAATLGAPLAGAVGAVFWTRVSDARSGADLAAGRVVTGIGENWGMPDFLSGGYAKKIWHRPDTGDARDCDGQIIRQLNPLDRKGILTAHIYGAIVLEEQRYGASQANFEAEQPFLRLPDAALGFLAQCMEHSLLSGACASWARHRLDQDVGVKRKITAALLASAKEGDDQACLLLDWVKQSSAKAKS